MSAAKAQAGKTLFTLPIKDDLGEGGVVVSEPVSKVYLVTFRYGSDNRLTSAFCQAILLALDILEHRYDPGVVITTSSIQKFYSNGMDIAHSVYTPHYFRDSLYFLWRRFLTYPMPTVALINGHAFAGGLMLAMMHDYRIMNPHKGFVSLNELELGAPLRPPMTSIFRQKLSGATLRRMVLEAHRFKALEALEEGIIDWIGGLDEALKHIEEFNLVKKAQPGATGVSVYAQLKSEMWRETVEHLASRSEEDMHHAQVTERARLESTARERKVKEWETKAKL